MSDLVPDADGVPVRVSDADGVPVRVLDMVPVYVSDMEVDSVEVGVADSDARMVNEFEKDGGGDDPIGEAVALNEGVALMDEDQEDSGVPPGVAVADGCGVKELEGDRRMDGVDERVIPTAGEIVEAALAP